MASKPKHSQHAPSERLLLVMPNSLADVVMATPALRAFRRLYPQARITALVRRHLRPLLDACPWVDRIVSARQKNRHAPTAKRTGPIKLARRLAGAKFDTAVLMPDGLRAALLVRLAGIPRRVGYDRSSRSGVLTDRLLHRRVMGRFVPVAMREHYLGLARYLGAVDTDPAMQLFTREADDQLVARLFAEWGVSNDTTSGRISRPLFVLVPGAGSDALRTWPARRFAELADRCAKQFDAVIALSGSPAERPLLDEVKRHAVRPLIDLPSMGIDLTLLKSVIRQSHLVITNDNGPRQMAAALGTPAVTLLADEPLWSDTGVDHERHVHPSSAPAGKTAPTPHDATVDEVVGHVAQIMSLPRRSATILDASASGVSTTSPTS